MLYHLLLWLQSQNPEPLKVFNVVRYQTFRAMMAFFTAIVIAFVIGPPFIRWMQVKKFGQPIREEGPESHYSKKNTPTMGGTFILLALVFGTLLWSRLDHPYTWAVVLVTVGYGAIGFWDDWKKIAYKDPRGLAGRKKLFWQTSIALVAMVGVYVWSLPSFKPLDECLQAQPFWRMGMPCFEAGHISPTELHVPFFKDFHPDIGWFYLPFAIFVIVGTSNAVNLTDGLDGLAIGPTMIEAGTFGIFAYLGGNAVFSAYLNIPFVPGVGELILFCAATIGAGLGFLWYNTYPAQVFMGDVGALALGGALGTMAVVTKNEFVSAVIGGIFVLEAVSVMIQVAYYKWTIDPATGKGRRIFLMAPIHHHFEKKGWPEPKVIVRFWIISILLALGGLATLKLR